MSASEVARWYPSKVDWWLGLVLVLAPATTVLLPAIASPGLEGLLVAAGGAAFFALLYLGVVLPMRYGITDEVIIVRHGLVRQRIPLGAITEVYPTRNPLSSPALSLDRLYIRFGTGFFAAAMISPADKAGFLAELQARAGLVRQGEKLVRAAAH